MFAQRQWHYLPGSVRQSLRGRPSPNMKNKPTPVAIARKSAVPFHIVQRTALIALAIVFLDFATIPHGHQRFSAR
jgi:hypothetical protein